MLLQWLVILVCSSMNLMASNISETEMSSMPESSKEELDKILFTACVEANDSNLLLKLISQTKLEDEQLSFYLIQLVRSGNIDLVDTILKHYSFNSNAINGALIEASEHGKLDIAKLLVEGFSADVSHCCFKPLLRAFRNGHSEIVQYLAPKSDISPNFIWSNYPFLVRTTKHRSHPVLLENTPRHVLNRFFKEAIKNDHANVVDLALNLFIEHNESIVETIEKGVRICIQLGTRNALRAIMRCCFRKDLTVDSDSKFLNKFARTWVLYLQLRNLEENNLVKEIVELISMIFYDLI